MITSKEAQQISLKVAEEGIKYQLREIEKLIIDACEKGERHVCIVGADKKLFPKEQDQLDALFVLEEKYGFDAFTVDGELHIYWYQLKNK